MAHSARNTVGFERVYNKTGFPANAIDYEGSSGSTYAAGQLVRLESGKATAMTYQSSGVVGKPIVGVAAETSTALTTADVKIKVFPVDNEVLKVSFDNHMDINGSSNASSGSYFYASTLDNNATAEPWNQTAGSTTLFSGALIYIYEGPGKGDVRIIDEMTTGGANSSHVIEVTNPFSATPTSASKAIVLIDSSGSTLSSGLPGIGPGRLVGLSTASALKVACGSTAAATEAIGMVVSVDPENLTADVMIAPSLILGARVVTS